LAATEQGISSDRPWLVVFFLDDLKDVTIRVTEEKPSKWRFAQGLDESSPMRPQPRFQPGKLGARACDRNMAAEFPLESRRLEFGVLNQMQFASWSDFEPGGCHADIAWPRDPVPTQNIPEERR